MRWVHAVLRAAAAAATVCVAASAAIELVDAHITDDVVNLIQEEREGRSAQSTGNRIQIVMPIHAAAPVNTAPRERIVRAGGQPVTVVQDMSVDRRWARLKVGGNQSSREVAARIRFLENNHRSAVYEAESFFARGGSSCVADVTKTVRDNERFEEYLALRAHKDKHTAFWWCSLDGFALNEPITQILGRRRLEDLFPSPDVMDSFYFAHTVRPRLVATVTLPGKRTFGYYYLIEASESGVSPSSYTRQQMVDIFISTISVANSLTLRQYALTENIYYCVSIDPNNADITFHLTPDCIREARYDEIQDLGVKNLRAMGSLLVSILSVSIAGPKHGTGTTIEIGRYLDGYVRRLRSRTVNINDKTVRRNSFLCASKNPACDYLSYPLYHVMLEFLVDTILLDETDDYNAYASYIVIPIHIFEELMLETFDSSGNPNGLDFHDILDDTGLPYSVFGLAQHYFAAERQMVYDICTNRLHHSVTLPLTAARSSGPMIRRIDSFSTFIKRSKSPNAKHILYLNNFSEQIQTGKQTPSMYMTFDIIRSASRKIDATVYDYNQFAFDVADGSPFFVFPKLLETLNYMYVRGFAFKLPSSFLNNTAQHGTRYRSSGVYVRGNNARHSRFLNDGTPFLYDAINMTHYVVPTTFENVGDKVHCAPFDTVRASSEYEYTLYLNRATVFCMGLDYIRRRLFYDSPHEWDIFFNIITDSDPHFRKTNYFKFRAIVDALMMRNYITMEERFLMYRMTTFKPAERPTLKDISSDPFWGKQKRNSVLTQNQGRKEPFWKALFPFL